MNKLRFILQQYDDLLNELRQNEWKRDAFRGWCEGAEKAMQLWPQSDDVWWFGAVMLSSTAAREILNQLESEGL